MARFRNVVAVLGMVIGTARSVSNDQRNQPAPTRPRPPTSAGIQIHATPSPEGEQSGVTVLDDLGRKLDLASEGWTHFGVSR